MGVWHGCLDAESCGAAVALIQVPNTKISAEHTPQRELRRSGIFVNENDNLADVKNIGG